MNEGLSIEPLKRYIVGGAVRDKLLGKPASDRDWVIINGSPDALREMGYHAIYRKDATGKLASFPVFLHPETHEEHALARRSLADPPANQDPWARFRAVTLLEDLSNRDYTINAMAETPAGELVDPLNGRSDLENGVIRHAGEAFSEDPLRVLRGARLAAQLPGFDIAPETATLFRQLAADNQLNRLDPNRVWNEVAKAMASPEPHRFIEVLHSTGVLEQVFPEVAALFGIPQPPKHHPEIDCGVHTLMVLEQAAKLTEDPRVRFAALVHDLGKALTPAHILPSHIGHEISGIDAYRMFAQRMTVPNRFDKVARLVIRHHLRCHTLTQAKASSVAKLLRDLGAYRDPEIVSLFSLACLADARGRKGLENTKYPQVEILEHAFEASRDVTGAMFLGAGHEPGPNIGQMVIAEQVRRIKSALAV